MNRREFLKTAAAGGVAAAAWRGGGEGSEVICQDPLVLKDDYLGRRADAEWRAAAAERIEKYRKADLCVKVVDANGKGVSGATVKVEMKRNAFYFGSRADVNLITEDTADAKQYREVFLEMFNYATVNRVYYSQWRTERQANRTLEPTLPAIEWLKKHGYPMRGHTLVWNLRDETINKSKEDVYKRVMQHIEQTAGDVRLAGAFDEWDVQNEPVANSDIFRKLGREATADFFRRTHELDPTARLFLNEARMISQMHREPKQRQDFIWDLVRWLQDEDVPLHGLGFQGHHVETLAPTPEVIGVLNRFAELGLNMQVTEYDTKLRAASPEGDYKTRWQAPSETSPELEKLEGEYIRDFLTGVFSVPQMTGFIMWGFWDGRHWLYNGPLFRKDWSVKPAGRVWHDLVCNRWRTVASKTSDGEGECRIRGFLGEYDVTASHHGRKVTTTVQLAKTGSRRQLVLPG